MVLVSSAVMLQPCYHVCSRPGILVANSPASQDVCAVPREKAECESKYIRKVRTTPIFLSIS